MKAVNPLNAYYNTVPAHMSIYSDSIISAQSYQRPVNPNHVRDIVSGFDAHLFAEPLVSFRGGKYYLIDGQNRISALVWMNHGNPVSVKCTVFTGLTEADEANLFAKQDKLNRKLTPFEYINASSNGNDKDSDTTKKFLAACAECGVTIKNQKSSEAGSFMAANALLNAYKKYGDTAFKRVVPLILDTWQGNWDSKSISFINAMFAFDKRYSGKYSRRRFISASKKLSPAQLLYTAKAMVGSTSECVCAQLANAYNHGIPDAAKI